MGNFITDYEGDENDPIPTWLFVCPACGIKFTIRATGNEAQVPIRPCVNCGKDVKGGF